MLHHYIQSLQVQQVAGARNRPQSLDAPLPFWSSFCFCLRQMPLCRSCIASL